MENLFKKNRILNQEVFRNIVYLKNHPGYRSKTITTSKDEATLEQAEFFGRKQVNTQHKESDFFYTTSIGYPFRYENYASTRYSDGSFPIWYGSLQLATTCYETAFNSLKDEFDIEGLDNEIIIRERAVFNIHCKGIFVDLIGVEQAFPKMISDDYGFCQKVGKIGFESGFPGLITPSVRYQSGENVNVFKQNALSLPKLDTTLLYKINLSTKVVDIIGEDNELFLSINF